MYNPYRAYPYANMSIYNMPPFVLPPYYMSLYPPHMLKYFNRMNGYMPEPFVTDINKATIENNTFRTAIWTGENLQVTVMSIPVGEDIGLEVHPTVDQFIRIEQGEGLVQMGNREDDFDFEEMVYDDFAIMVPAGKWHNVTNTGTEPLKLYAIYAPPEHPVGTVHQTKADAELAEQGHSMK